VNTIFFRTLLTEELQTWHEGQTLILNTLPEVTPHITYPKFRALVEELNDHLQRRKAETEGLLRTFVPQRVKVSNDLISTVVQEVRVLIQRDSHLDPSRVDIRLLSLLRKACHIQMATLKSLLLFAHLLEAGEAEEILSVFLAEEIQRDQDLSNLGPSLLKWNAVETVEEGKELLRD
jgi:ferritin-like metal-binding protein YciE